MTEGIHIDLSAEVTIMRTSFSDPTISSIGSDSMAPYQSLVLCSSILDGLGDTSNERCLQMKKMASDTFQVCLKKQPSG
ncbi:hypothetical protein WDU94_012969 [Cyamophila willieti]